MVKEVSKATLSYYKVYKDFNMFRIKWSGSGKLAKDLSGSYTSIFEAENAINVYESKPKQRSGTRKITKAKLKRG